MTFLARKGVKIAIIVIAVLAAIGVSEWKFGWIRSAFANSKEQAQVDEITAKVLTVNLDKQITDLFKNVSMEFLDTRMASKDHARTSAKGISDAVSFPFNSSDKAAMLKEVEEEILRCPIYCDMVIRGMKDIKVGSKTIGSYNPWMAEFEQKANTAYAQKSSPKGPEIWLTQYEGDSKIYVTDDFRLYAACVCVLLERLENVGVLEGWESTENYNLPLIAKNSERRTEKSDYQEDKPCLGLRYVDKTGKARFYIGFNTLDKRFEIVKEPTKEQQSGGGGSKTVTPVPTPVPTPTPDPDPPQPDPDPDPVKDPSKDPVNQGNAERGGGKNQESDGTGEYQPTQPEKDQGSTRHVDQGSSSSGSGSSSGGSQQQETTPWTPPQETKPQGGGTSPSQEKPAEEAMDFNF